MSMGETARSLPCECGCGGSASSGRRFLSGHNLRNLSRTETHRRKIGDAQRRAWATKRKRTPIGSRWQDAGGYIRVKVSEGSDKWRLEHVLVMERLLGRSVADGEVVHHVNGNRADNREENLFLCSSHSHHMAIERQLKETFRDALAKGLIAFDSATGRYGLK